MQLLNRLDTHKDIMSVILWGKIVGFVRKKCCVGNIALETHVVQVVLWIPRLHPVNFNLFKMATNKSLRNRDVTIPEPWRHGGKGWFQWWSWVPCTHPPNTPLKRSPATGWCRGWCRAGWAVSRAVSRAVSSRVVVLVQACTPALVCWPPPPKKSRRPLESLSPCLDPCLDEAFF